MQNSEPKLQIKWTPSMQELETSLRRNEDLNPIHWNRSAALDFGFEGPIFPALGVIEKSLSLFIPPRESTQLSQLKFRCIKPIYLDREYTITIASGFEEATIHIHDRTELAFIVRLGLVDTFNAEQFPSRRISAFSFISDQHRRCFSKIGNETEGNLIVGGNLDCIHANSQEFFEENAIYGIRSLVLKDEINPPSTIRFLSPASYRKMSDNGTFLK